MFFLNFNSTKSIKEAIYRRWCVPLAEIEKKRKNIQKTIEENLKFYSLEVLKKVGPIEKFLINIDGKCYVVDFCEKNIYLCIDDDIKQYLAIKEKYRYCTEASWYKYYTNDYKDIEIIINFIGNYLANRKIQRWNTIQRLDEAVNFITEKCKNSSFPFNGFLFFGNSRNSRLLFDINNNCSFNYEKFIFDYINVCNLVDNFNFFNIVRSYRNFLISNKYSEDDTEKEYRKLNKIVSFLKYFEINKQLFSVINEKKNREDYDKVSVLSINKQEEGTKNLLKKINPKLFNLVNIKEQQGNYNYEKFKNSLKFNFSKTDTTKLFYNPRTFNFLLPENFTIHGSRISVYVANNIDFRDFNTKTTKTIKNLMLHCIEIVFSLYLYNYKFFFVIKNLADFLKKIDDKNIDIFHNIHEIRKISDEAINKTDEIKKDLIRLIKNKKRQLLQCIFSKMDEHVNSDMFLIDYAENYFDKCNEITGNRL